MSNNVTREQHLQSLASAAQQFALSTQADTLSLVIEAFQAAGNSSAASTTTLTTPNLSLGEWSKDDTTYTASLSYSGDGTLSTNIGSISGTTLSVTDEDGIFSGVVTATAGTSYAATKLNFSYTTEDTGGGVTGKSVPTFVVGERYTNGEKACFPITYDGDVTVVAWASQGTRFEIVFYGSYSNGVVSFGSGSYNCIFNFILFGATETDNYYSAFVKINNSNPA